MTRDGSYGTVDAAAAEAEAERLRRQAASAWDRERAALETLGLSHGERLLDVGCGTGAVLARVQAAFAPRLSVGIEIDPENVRRAAQVTHVVRGDARNLPFANSTFDAVLFRLVLRHIRDPERLIADAQRVLSPGGAVYAVDTDDSTLMLDPSPEGWPELRIALEESARRRGGNPRVGRTVRRLLLEAGLTQPRTAVVGVTTDDVPASMFVDVFLAPNARPVDADLLDRTSTEKAWANVRAWARRPDAFGWALGVFASARKPA